MNLNLNFRRSESSASGSQVAGHNFTFTFWRCRIFSGGSAQTMQNLPISAFAYLFASYTTSRIRFREQRTAPGHSVNTTQFMRKHLYSQKGQKGCLVSSSSRSNGSFGPHFFRLAQRLVNSEKCEFTIRGDGYRLALRHCSIQAQILSKLSSMSSGVLLGNSNTMLLS